MRSRVIGAALTVVWLCACGESATAPDDAGVADTQVDVLARDRGPKPTVAGNYEVFFLAPPFARTSELAPLYALIDELLADPAVAMLRMLAYSASGRGYAQEAPWSFLFSCSAAPCDFAPLTAAGEALVAVLEKDADRAIVALDLGVDSLGDAFAKGEPRFSGALDFYLASTLELLREPGQGGELGADHPLLVEGFGWHFGGTSVARLSVPAAVNIGARVVPYAGPSPDWGLALERFELSVGYVEGLMVLVRVPVLLGAIDSSGVARLFRLYDCADLEHHLACSGPYATDATCSPSPQGAPGAIQAACVSMQRADDHFLAEMARTFVGGETTFVISSPAGSGCAIHPGEGTNVADRLGRSPEECPLTVELHYEGVKLLSSEGSWKGTRQ